jgi:nitrogen fixation/metabolism regulation signal transduction histidine kinase
VADSGIGLEGKGTEHLFEPFVTSKEKGSGLGLSVVRRIVEEEHGGSVELRGRGGGGAEAIVRLPRRRS